MPPTIRRATLDEPDAIAQVFSSSFRLLPFLPSLHTPAEDRRFIEDVILRRCEVTLAEDASGIVSFLALQSEEMRLLYTRPDRFRTGAGTLLIEAPKASGVAVLELWCFQANARARRFYEARGFRAIRLHGRRRQRGENARRALPLANGRSIGVTTWRETGRAAWAVWASNPRGPYEM